MRNFLIFDAHAIIHRAYHALPPLRNRDGKMVNAVYGFLLVFLKVVKEYRPGWVAVCFDPPGKTFRDEIYREYKANRREADQDLESQFPYVKDILSAFGVALVEHEGYEADDCIGTLVAWRRKHLPDSRVIIVTGDTDTLQLVDDDTSVYLLRKGMSDTVLVSREYVKERYGVEPRELADWKALRGDASDHIPGVRGIGEKTATELISTFHSVENVYRHRDCIESEAVRKKLEDGRDSAFLSLRLATIAVNVPLGISKTSLEFHGVEEGAAAKKLHEYHFTSLISKMPVLKAQGGVMTSSESRSPREGTRESAQLFLFRDCDRREREQLKSEWRARGVVVRTYQDRGNPVIVLFSPSRAVGILYEDFVKESSDIAEILGSPEIKKIGHNLKRDYKELKRLGFHLSPLWFDCEIAAYLLDAGRRSYGLSFLSAEYAGEPYQERENRSFAPDVSAECELVWKLFLLLESELQQRDLHNLFHSFDMPLVPLLAEMEWEGVKLDTGFLKAFGKELEKKLDALTKQIMSLAGIEFNVHSPRQLKDVLFEKLGISSAGLGRTKTGISTGAEELEKIRSAHPIIPKILEYRELFKLKSTYVDTLPSMVDEHSRVHTTFHQTIAATGRLSSQDPNLQNIPIRTPEGSKMRKAFVARRGWKLLSADYSQFELRVAASLSRDPELLKAFQSGADIHAATAAGVFHIPLSSVTPEQRRSAKAINFGILYGLGARGLAQSAGMSVGEAKEFIRKYFEIHKGLKAFFEKVVREGRERGYVETLFGRRRYLPDLHSPVQQLRSAAERMAINHPIQGSQADLVKLAMIHTHQALDRAGLRDEVKMILQVHDELVFEVRDEALSRARAIIEHELTHVYRLWVPIEVEIGVGKNWAECHR